MARIETGSQPIQLRLPESSTVIVIPKGPEPKKPGLREETHEEPLIDPQLIAGIVQDRLYFGREDVDRAGRVTEFELTLRVLKSNNIPYERISQDIDSGIDQITLEGRHIGIRHPVLKEVSSGLKLLAEEIMTQPDPTQPSPAQTASSPQKHR